MPTAIKMPKLGMTMTEGTIVDWPIAIGDHVEKGAAVLVIETEKAEVEVEATASGFFRHVYVEVGGTVPCATLLAALTETDDEPFDAEAFEAAEGGPPSAAPVSSEGGAPAGVTSAGPGKPGGASAASPASRGGRDGRKPIAPAARALLRKLGFQPEEVLAKLNGTGPGGRVTKADVEAWAAARAALVPVADGVSLEVHSTGEGDVVLLLPGFGTDAAAFARQTPVLTERFEVRAMNPRGVGLSDAPELDRYDPILLASDAAALVDEPAHVIGASMGAAVAVELALARPDRVRSLMLLTPAIEANIRLAAVLDMWCRLAAEATPPSLATALMPWLFSDAVLGDEKARERTVRGLADIVARVPAVVLRRYAAGLLAWAGSRMDELEKIAVPTLVIAAADDLLTPGADRVAARIPGADLVVIEGAGHAVGLEDPEAVNAALLRHLETSA